MALDENLNGYVHLVELGGSDYEIVDGEPNIKGWDVKNEQGQKIGDVDELLFDPQSRKVRYIIVDLDDNKLDLEEDKKILIPIGVAQLHDSDDNSNNHREDFDTRSESDNLVVGQERGNYDTTNTYDNDKVNNRITGDTYDTDDNDDVVTVPVTVEQLRSLPAYHKDGVTPEMESTIRNVFEGAGAAGVAGAMAYNKNEFYDHDHFNEDKFYDRGATATSILPVIEENLEVGKREVETGGARIVSKIVERPVQESVNLKEEHVTVEHTPVNRPVSAADVNAFKEQDFELTERKEVPVVSKEARVVEEVSLNKDVTEKEETIKETLRNTEVEAERIDLKRTNRE